VGWDFDLHPDGERAVVAPTPDAVTAVKQDKVVFVFDFLDDLRRATSSAK
jgi:hypothetical protein